MKIFKMTKFKRLFVLLLTLTGAILAISLGSTYYVSKNNRKSIEYAGGAEYNVDIKSGNAQAIATDVAQSIYERVNSLGVNGISVESEKSKVGASVRIVAPGLKSNDDKKAFESLITEKPQLVLTDFYGNPLFNKNGHFRSSVLTGDPKGWAIPTSTMAEFYDYDPNNPKLIDTKVPIADGGAKAQLNQDGSRYVSIELNSNSAATEWTHATQYLSSLPANRQMVLAWLDPNKLIYNLKSFYKGLSQPTWSSMWNVISNPDVGFASLAKVISQNKPTNTYRTSVVNGKNYLVSEATVTKPLYGTKFTITGSFSSDKAKSLARNINYGTSNYKLDIKYSNTVNPTYGEDSFKKAMIAGIIVFSLIALVLIVNYGLLGALATISISLFLFLTLTMFTVMRGEYSPSAIAALIIGIGMAVDASIITFERLKAELYAGASIKKAFAQSNKKSISTIFDSNITTMLVALVLFYFGTRSIIGLSITLILSIVFTLLVMLLFTRFTATLLVRSGAFNNHRWLVGAKPKFDVKLQEKINKFDYIKQAKWFTMFSLVFSVAGIVVFAVFAGIGGGFKDGFVLSQDFAGGSNVSFLPQTGTFTSDNQAEIVKYLHAQFGVPIKSISASENAISFKSLSAYNINDFATLTKETGIQAIVNANTTSTDVARQLVKDAFIGIGIAMGAIIVYTLIRFKWTYSIASLIALVHDALIVVFTFIVFRLEVSPIFVAALLSVVGYSINDTIVTFDRVREKMSTHVSKIDKATIKLVANEAIRDTLKRSVLTSLTTMLAIIVLMCFGNATAMPYNIAMLVGLASGTYSSIFIATYIWTKLELFRQNSIKKRVKKGFWNTKGVEEQTIEGINDFNA